MDETTATWLGRLYGSFSPNARQEALRQHLLKRLSCDARGHYIELADVDKEWAFDLACDMVERSLMHTCREALMGVAKEICRYAGYDAIKRLANVVNPESSKVEGVYKSPRDIAMEKIRAREEEAKAQASRTQDSPQGA